MIPLWSESYYEELQHRREKTFLGGGERRIERQHAKGKLTARERLALLFDNGEYQEINQMIESRSTDFGMPEKKVPGDGIVTAYGKINGRLAYAASQDFTVCGGSGGEEYALKMCKLLELAIKTRAPFINLNDSGGARIEEGICSLSAYSRLFYLNSVASGLIPQIAAIMGPCAGGASYSPALCDYIFMVRGNSQMYLTGPAVVKTVTMEDVTAEELGGADVHMRKSGVAHFAYDDEIGCLNGIRQLLSYLPSNCDEKPPVQYGRPMDLCRGLDKVVVENSRLIYDVNAVIGAFTDRHSFFEVQKEFAPNIVVGFARIEGKAIGIVANQPNYLAGSLGYNAADKAARFVRFCDCFNIPLLSLVDVPAFLPGKDQEYAGVIRHGAKLLYAFSEATVPKICLIMRKGYGGAFCAMNSKSLSADVVYAWPIAQVAVMGAQGAVSIIFNKQIKAAEDPEAERAALVQEYEEKFMNPYYAASRGFVDEVILPTETKAKILAALEALENKREERPRKKHDNMPM